MKDLILLHGALGHPDDFTAFEQELSQHFTLHKILFAGHGDSPVPEPIRMESYVQQLEQYITEHDLDQVHIFGYSMGGYVALYYAMQHPRKVASLLTLATRLRWTEEGALKEGAMLNPATIKEKVPKYAARLEAQHGAGKWESLLPAIADMMVALGKKPLLDISNYPGIGTRVQLMVGDKDVMVSLDETLQAAKSIPDARFAVLPHTRHPLEQVRPALLMALMRDFWEL